jgi:polar amino acid transport system substrate-binding protein
MARIGASLIAMLLLPGCTETMHEVTDATRRELASTGELRVALAVGPAVSATFAVEDSATGALHGPTVTLGAALAKQLKVSVRYVIYSNSGEITAAGPLKQWDVTFVPVDTARAAVIDFGPDYCLFDSTYLVRAGLAVESIAALDRAGITVGAVNSTTTGRAASRNLQRATLQTYASVAEMRDLLARGDIDAIALSRLSLTTLAAELPGTRILDEGFHSTATAIAVPKGNTAALAYVSDFIEAAKRSGLARRALDAAGLQAAKVAPPIDSAI